MSRPDITVTLPARQVAVLNTPLTRNEAAARQDLDGVVRTVTSLDWQEFAHLSGDSLYDLLAASVLADLSGEWTLTGFVPVGPDPRAADQPRVLVAIDVAPGYPDT